MHGHRKEGETERKKENKRERERERERVKEKKKIEKSNGAKEIAEGVFHHVVGHPVSEAYKGLDRR